MSVLPHSGRQSTDKQHSECGGAHPCSSMEPTFQSAGASGTCMVSLCFAVLSLNACT